MGEYKLGNIIIEGKTKQVYDLPNNPGLCLLLSKDRITAGDGVKAHDLAGKAAVSNRTNAKVFEILNSVGNKKDSNEKLDLSYVIFCLHIIFLNFQFKASKLPSLRLLQI